MTRYAWLQKHPTPAARAGEFHWYPSSGDRELQASFAERLRSANGATLWQLARDEVAWALPFVAVAADGRRYTGLAVAVADSLERLVPAIGAPWTDATVEPQPATPPRLPDLPGVARALLDGGSAAVGDPAHPGLPRALAALAKILPARGLRRGTWTAGTRTAGPDHVAELVARAVMAPDSRAARGWRLACELASAGRSVDEILAASAPPADAWLATLNAW
ncbi:MAG: hypothetical protein ABI678_32380, partial [Kofleriaceae bacterium]